jgi:heme exporter protein D
MNWHDAAGFWAMGGYGAYVWGAYGVTALVIAAEAWLVARRGRRALAACRAEHEQ